MAQHKPFVRSKYNYDQDSASEESGLRCEDESRTQQSFKDETDINVILRRFNVTGELPQGVRMPTYADFSEVYDFHSAANAIAQANEAFEAMPADVRAKFQNDPAKFVAFCSKEENREEAKKLGLIRDDRLLDTPREATVDATVTTATAPTTVEGGSAGGAVPTST